MITTLTDYFWDGKSMTYTSGFSVVLVKTLSVLGGLQLFVAFAIQLTLFLLQRNKKKVFNNDYQINTSTSKLLSGDYEELEQKQPKVWIILEVVSSIFFWLGIWSFVIIFPILFGFEHLNLALAIITSLVVLLLSLTYQLIRCQIYSDHSKPKSLYFRTMEIVSKYKYLVIPIVIIISFLAIFLPFVFEKSCLCIYSSGYGIPTILNLEYSSLMSRGQWLGSQVCKKDKICHFYATLPTKTYSEVFLNVQTGINLKEISLLQRSTQGLGEEILVACKKYPFPKDIEERGQRNMYTCHANQLAPDSTYKYFVYAGNPPHEPQNPLFATTYTTLPAIDTPTLKPLRILFGGDFGYQPKGIALVEKISEFHPDLILIGGDVAYDNGNRHCYYSWDLMLWAFEKEFQNLERTIPMIFSVGNHDVGFNSMSDMNITVSDEKGPLYFTYFPQASDLSSIGIPEIANRQTYMFHQIKNILLIGLDSGYIHDFDGPQKEWLINTLTANEGKYYPFTHYHNPIFPTCWNGQGIMSTGEAYQASVKHWIPIFDQFGMIGAFENHVHQYKRTYPLINMTLSQDPDKGTIYFGDGAMGIKEEICQPQDRTDANRFKGLFQSYQVEEASHYWIMDINPDNTITYNAYDPNKQLINGSYYKQDLNKRISRAKEDL